MLNEAGHSIEVPLFRVRKGLRVGFSDGQEAPYPPKAKASAGARSLALGYRLVRALEDGEARGTLDLARRLGVSHARVCALTALTYLAPNLQEVLLRGGPEAARRNFHQLLRVARIPCWREQRRVWVAFGL